MDSNHIDIMAVITEAKEAARAQALPSPLTRRDIVRFANKLLGLDPQDEAAITYGKIRGFDDGGILTPEATPSGRKTFRFYTPEDLERILAVKILELRHGVAPSQAKRKVAGAFEYGTGKTPAQPDRGIAVTDQETITGGPPRMQRYIWTRSLKFLFNIFFENLPPTTRVVVDKLDPGSPGLPPSPLTEVHGYSPEPGTLTMSPTRIVARLTKDSLPFIERALVFEGKQDLQGTRTFLFHDAETLAAYRIALVPPPGVQVKLTDEANALASSLDSYQVRVASTLLALSFKRFPMPPGTEQLQAMAEAVVQILPQVDHCGILLPQQGVHRQGTLAFGAVSADAPKSLGQATVNIGQLVAGWTFKESLPLFIEGIRPGDSRVSQLEEKWSAVATLPLSSAEQIGVLYVAREQPIPMGEMVFPPIARDLLAILAGIAGELVHSESIQADHTRSVLRAIRNGPYHADADEEMAEQLSAVLLGMRGAPADTYVGRNLCTVAVTIENLAEIAQTCGLDVARWVESQVVDNGGEVVGRETAERHTAYRFSPGRYAFLISPTETGEDTVKSAAIRLKRVLGSIQLSTSAGALHVDCHTWGIVYACDTYLQRRLQNSAPPTPTSSPESLAQDLTDRLAKTTLTLALNDAGHAAQGRRDWATAFECFSEAAALAPNLPYYDKHMAESLLGQDEPQQALERCDAALKKDPAYAGGHYMRGEVLARMENRSAEAFKEYEAAIQIADRPKPHVLYGISLAAHGDLDRAIQQFKEARKLDPGNAAKYDLMIARILSRQGKPVEARNKLQAITVEDDSGDKALIEFELKLLDVDAMVRTNSSRTQSAESEPADA